MNDHYDCIVLGGGPAGSTAATIVAESGFSTLLLEREKMPRFHIGESLMPETYWVFQRLGLLEKLKASCFTKKYSVQFVNSNGRESQPFFFDQHDPRECSQTWQVRRSDFDQMLFDNAAEKGAECHDATRVLEVLFDDAHPDKAVGVKLQTVAGETKQVAARVVIDATGQQSLIATRLGIRHHDPELRKSAIWTYYRGAERVEGPNGGATLVLHTEQKDSWFWYIPLEDDVTSVGVVGDQSYLLKGQSKPEEVFEQQLAICPAMQRRLEGAERVDKHFVAKEFTYKAERAAGEGWVLAGDAYSFIDPIYSSGVFFALYMGEKAADCVVAGLRSGNLSAEQLAGWVPAFENGAQWVRKLINAFYTQEFSFGQFVKAHPQHHGAVTDILIGRVFDEDVSEVFRDMESWMARQAESSAVVEA
jgi:flavin-dependent dehydrogenase